MVVTVVCLVVGQTPLGVVAVDSGSWAAYLEASLVAVNADGESSGLTAPDITSRAQALRDAVAAAVNRDMEGSDAAALYGAVDSRAGVAVHDVRSKRGPECWRDTEGLGEPAEGSPGACVSFDLHVRAKDDAHARALERSVERAVAEGAVAERLRGSTGLEVRLAVAGARAWHPTRDAPAAVHARVRLAARKPAGAATLPAGWGAREEGAFASGVARALDLPWKPTDGWDNYAQGTLVFTNMDGEATALRPADVRAVEAAVVEAYVDAINSKAGTSNRVAKHDVRVVKVADAASAGGSCWRDLGMERPVSGDGCVEMKVRVFADDAYDAALLGVALEEVAGGGALAAALATNAGLEVGVAARAVSVVQKEAEPVVPADVKIWQVEERPDCREAFSASRTWSAPSGMTGEYTCVDVSFYLTSPADHHAEERREGLERVVASEECTRADTAQRPWPCLSAQLEHVGGWVVQPVFLAQPYVVDSGAQGSGDDDDASPTQIVIGVVVFVVCSVAIGACMGYVYYRRKRSMGYNWVNLSTFDGIPEHTPTPAADGDVPPYVASDQQPPKFGAIVPPPAASAYLQQQPEHAVEEVSVELAAAAAVSEPADAPKTFSATLLPPPTLAPPPAEEPSVSELAASAPPAPAEPAPAFEPAPAPEPAPAELPEPSPGPAADTNPFAQPQ